MSFVGTWMNLETVILSKLKQEQNQTLHVLTHRWVLNNENTWKQGGEHHTLESVGVWRVERGISVGWGSRGGKALGEIPNVDDGVTDAANHHGTCIPM